MMPARVSDFSALSSIIFTAAIRSRAVLFTVSRAIVARSAMASEVSHPVSYKALPTLVGSKMDTRWDCGPIPSGSTLRMAVSLITYHPRQIVFHNRNIGGVLVSNPF